MKNSTTVEKKSTPMLSSGHRACAGCGQLIAARLVAETLGPDTIIANATGCLEVTTTPHPESAWGMPWIHSLFENAPAIASGVKAALKTRKLDKKIKVVAQGGDGSTFDIGFGLLSGMWERGDEVIYICYDNEAYANTGMQASGATPWASSTATTPAGKGKTIDAIGSHQHKKDMTAIALAHGLRYVAQCSIGYIEDVRAKVKQAMETEGPSYIQILVPCIPGWKIKPDQALQVARLAVQCGLYPSFEYRDGKLSKQMKTPVQTPSVDEYLKMQGRFSHLFKTAQGAKQIKAIQAIADNNIEKYDLK